MSDNNFQDWNSVILRKSAKQLKKDGKLPTVVVKKPQTSDNLRKLDNADGPEKIEKVSYSLKKQIMQARNVKTWTQKEFALKLGVPVKIVQSYENGTAIPDNKILNKMRSVLGTKLKK